LRELGHRVRITTIGDDDLPRRRSGARRAPAADGVNLLIALHARRSATVIRDFRTRYPERPLVVAMTGTDLYHDLARSRLAQRSLELADRLVVLQPAAVASLPGAARGKACVIRQSAVGKQVTKHWAAGRAGNGPEFQVGVLAHLRGVKDPFRAALAVRRLPYGSRIKVVHAGRALTEEMASRAGREMARNPRYRWVGELSHRGALSLLSRSQLLVVSSRLEGGANVIGEAAVRGVPVLASRVPGNVGLLGERYEGLFRLGDTRALADLLVRAETEREFYERLRRSMAALAPLFHPSRERQAWRRLLRELFVG
jgi:putative glycosyltransferase (TIGR04348 family)